MTITILNNIYFGDFPGRQLKLIEKANKNQHVRYAIRAIQTKEITDLNQKDRNGQITQKTC